MKPLSPHQDTVLRIVALHARDTWAKSRVFGGTEGRLGKTMRRLYEKGLVERMNVGNGEKVPYYHYRLSEGGTAYLKRYPTPPSTHARAQYGKGAPA